MSKSRQLRILLLKQGFSTDKDIITESKSERVSVLPLESSVAFKGRFLLENRSPSPPDWVEYVEDAIDGDLSTLNNASNAAVLLVEAKQRLFAITYGYGRNLLNPDCWVRDFGLKVTLNTVDPRSLKSVDSRTFEDFTVTTRRQSTQPSGLHVFGLNVTRDLMRQAMGTPREKSFATMVAGSDVLILRAPIPIEDLAKRCGELLAKYNDDAYKKEFAFIDNLKVVRDPSTVNELNDVLFAKLQSLTLDGIHLAPPEPFDPEGTDGYVYQKRKDAQRFADLDLEECLAVHSATSIDVLKKAKIGPKYPASEYGDLKWSMYNSIVAELEHDGLYYVLTCGDWYEIQKDFVQRVNKRVASLVKGLTKLPDAKRNEWENAYNLRVGRVTGLMVLDCKCQRVDGSKIEPCDLLSRSGAFIHVKRKTRSATLSHLFEQGVISADCLLSDQAFRIALRAEIDKSDKKLAKKITDKRPDPNEFRVVFAIVTNRSKNWPKSLPFFSRLHLMNAADHLEREGLDCELVRVDET